MPSDISIAERAASRALDARPPLTVSRSKEYFVQGITSAGARFRPADWAERLCGVLSPYRPDGPTHGRPAAHLGYSSCARPTIVGGIKCVIVDERLRELEPMAFDFVMSFARDNDLPVVEACSILETAPD